jgi:primary-amine oxidase
MALYGDLHQATGAGWSVWWRIGAKVGSGLEVWFADFHGRRVLWRGTQPFAIVPYHVPVPGTEPPGPHFTYKDGLNPQGGGAEFRALNHGAANSPQWWQDPSQNAAKDTDAVVVDVEPASDFEPAVLAISAKFQCGWYQYVHRWEFRGDGEIRPHLGMGGGLNPYAKTKAHVHHMYFRIDLDIDGFSSDVFEVFDHTSYNDPAGDGWKLVTVQGKHLADPKKARKFRIHDLKSKSAQGDLRGYEIELPQSAPTDTHSTGDVWVTIYRGDTVQQGADVGFNSDDKELETVYATGPLNTVAGSDIVLWVVVRHHHEPRYNAEEAEFLPYHYEEFHINPRGFEVLHIGHGHEGQAHEGHGQRR